MNKQPLKQLQFSNNCSNPNTVFSEKYKKQILNKQNKNNKIQIIYNSCSCKK